MGETIYILCALTSLGCAGLLLRSWWKTRARLLLWSTVCFVGLFLNNVLLFVDLVLTPDVDLSPWRALLAVVTIGIFIYGLIFDGG